MNMQNDFVNFVVVNRENGDWIDTAKTMQDAKKILEQYEDYDKKGGSYTPNFYDIVEPKNCDSYGKFMRSNYPFSFVDAMWSIGRIKSVIDLSEPYRCEDNPFVALVKDEDGVDYLVFYCDDCKETTLQILEKGFEDKVLKLLLEGDHLYGHEDAYKNYALLLAYQELDGAKLTFRHNLFLNATDTKDSVWKMVLQDMFAWNLHEEADCVVMVKRFYETAMPPFEDFKKGLKEVVLDALADLSPNASSIDLRNGRFDFQMPVTDKDYMEIYKKLRDSFHTLQANGEDFLDVYENYAEENRAEYTDKTYKF